MVVLGSIHSRSALLLVLASSVHALALSPAPLQQTPQLCSRRASLSPAPPQQPQKPQQRCSRRASFLLPVVALPLAAFAEGGEGRLLGEGAVGDAPAPFTQPLPERAKRGVFSCFDKRDDGKIVDVCKEQRIEEAKSAPPVVRNVERDVDMDSIRAVQAEIRSRPRQIKNRETPDWLKGTRDTTNDARPRFDGY